MAWIDSLARVRLLPILGPLFLDCGTSRRVASRWLTYPQAREEEEKKARDAENPLRSAIETFALTASDVDIFVTHFGAMDTNRTGECGHGTSPIS